ncbi:MAG: hypothetical protein NZ839_02135 [Endomicrobia bacterium]|nr:hypothetical protein [Endomicrobiia bacterium]
MIIIVGIFLIILGLLYFYKQMLLIRFCQVIKKYVFNEQVIVLYGKKIGIFLILSGIVFTGVGIQKITSRNLIYTAYKYYHSKNFSLAEQTCQNLLKEDTKNADAMLLLGKIYFITGRYYLAKSIFMQMKNIEVKKRKEVEKYITMIEEKLKK